MLPLGLVIDTNILISAAIKPAGLQRTVLLLAITRPGPLICVPTDPRGIQRSPWPSGTANSQGCDRWDGRPLLTSEPMPCSSGLPATRSATAGSGKTNPGNWISNIWHEGALVAVERQEEVHLTSIRF
jgi:hypothetical protein